MTKVLRLLAEAKPLPLGHVKKVMAEKAVKAEYGECHEIERKWSKRIGYSHLPLETIYPICNSLCSILGERPINKIIYNCSKVGEFSCADYSSRTIRFRYHPDLITLMHELAHHFDRTHSHGKTFVEILDFLFRVYYDQILKRKIHEDW